MKVGKPQTRGINVLIKDMSFLDTKVELGGDKIKF
jgi:hypothetical protein